MNPILFALSVAASAADGPSPERALARAEQAFDAVDATEDQRSTARVILEDALPAMIAFHEEAHDIHERFHALFLEPKIDRDALEATRVDAVDLFDRGTATALDLFADLAEVFTPEQRAILQDHRERMRERWTHWRE